MNPATIDYLNRPLRSAEDMADDLKFDVIQLSWLVTALKCVIDEHATITRDYPFLGDETAAAAHKEIRVVEAKIAELKEHLATLRGTP